MLWTGTIQAEDTSGSALTSSITLFADRYGNDLNNHDSQVPEQDDGEYTGSGPEVDRAKVGHPYGFLARHVGDSMDSNSLFWDTECWTTREQRRHDATVQDEDHDFSVAVDFHVVTGMEAHMITQELGFATALLPTSDSSWPTQSFSPLL